MRPRYRLYGNPWTRTVGPMMVLEELGLDYEFIPIDTRNDEHRNDTFLAINPAGFLPALTSPEGQHLHEAAAIMLYLAERHGGPELVPGPQEEERGRFLSLFFYLTNDIQPPTKRFFYPWRYTVTDDQASEVRAQARLAAEDRWAVLDRMIANGGGPWHLGQRFSIADLQMALWANYGFEDLDDIVGAFPAVRQVYEDVLARPVSGPLLRRQRSELEAWRATRQARPADSAITDAGPPTASPEDR